MDLTIQKRKITRRIIATGLILLCLSLYSVFPVFASPPGSPYAPGETTDPNCLPTDPNCTVASPLATLLSTSTSITMGTSTLNFGTSTLFISASNTRVGIGTSTPVTTLDVAGGVRLGSNAGVYNILNTSVAAGAPSGNLYWGSRQLVDSANIGDFGVSQITVGNGLIASSPTSAVALTLNVDATLSTSSQLGLNLSNANTWLAAQAFNATTTLATTTINNLLSVVGAGTSTFSYGATFATTGGGVGIGTTATNNLLTINSKIQSYGSARSRTGTLMEVSKTYNSFGVPVHFQSVWDFPADDGTGVYGLEVDAQSAGSNANNMTGNITGLVSRVEHTGTGVASNLTGLNASAGNRSSAGQVATATAIYAQAKVDNSSDVLNGIGLNIQNLSKDGHMNNSYGIYVQNQMLINSNSVGYVTNTAGLVIDDMNVGASGNVALMIGQLSIPAGNYAIYNASTQTNYFAGPISASGTLSVAGNTGLSTLTFTNATGTNFNATGATFTGVTTTNFSATLLSVLGNSYFGTIASGTWSGDIITAAKGGTGQDTSGWSGFVKVTGGTWATSTVSVNDLVSSSTLALLAGNQTFTGLNVFSATTTLATATINNNLTVGGNVGIGTVSPTQKLDIEKGHIRLGQVAAPSAPTVAVNLAAGNLFGDYYYRVSFVTALGETEVGAASALVSPSGEQVNLTNIPTSADSAVTARRIYRTPADEEDINMQLVATISDNATTVYTDNINDGSLGVSAPKINTTGGIIYNGSAKMGIADGGTTAWGLSALTSNTGQDNSAFGWQALYTNATGYYNTAVGAQALYTNATGYYNTAVGRQSLYANTSGNSNIAVGGRALYANTTGQNNIAVGVTALDANTSGISNVAIGSDALTDNTSGSYNVAVGINAMAFNTTGTNNVAIGTTAGGSITTGTGNVFLGYLSGYTASQKKGANNSMALGNLTFTTADNQVVLGNASVTQTILRGALAVGTTTNPGIFFNFQGTSTAPFATGTIFNVASSTGSSLFNVMANGNVNVNSGLFSFVTATGTSVTSTNLYVSGTSNLANITGNADLTSITSTNANFTLVTGNGNFTSITSTNANITSLTGNAVFTSVSSTDANFTLVTGNANFTSVTSTNASFGLLSVTGAVTSTFAAPLNVTVGAINVAKGYSYKIADITVLAASSTGANIFAGEGAGRLITTGFNNTAVGWQSLWVTTSSRDNVAVGTQALWDNTGSYNTALGSAALNVNTTASDNTAVGYLAGGSIEDGGRNTAVGSWALPYLVDGVNNVAIGYEAGYSLDYSANGNVMLGYRAGYYETGSDKLYIANSSTTVPLIYGDFSTGFLGLGTTSPYAKLTVWNGNIVSDDGSASSTLASNTLTVGATSTNSQGVFSVTSAGNTSASGTVTSWGNKFLTTNFAISEESTSYLRLTNQGVSAYRGLYTNDLRTNNGSASAPAYSFYNDTNTGIYLTANDSNILAIAANGVALASFGGTVSGAKFEVGSTGNVSASGTLSVLGTGTSTFANGATFATTGGNFGIGTSSPSQKFTVIGNIFNPIQSSSGVQQNTSIAVGASPRAIAVSGRYAYVANFNGNTVSVVDISNPAAPAQVATAAVGASPRAIAVSGRYAYVANSGGDTISVVDISNPAAPAQVATTSVSDAPYAIAVSGRYAYVANSASSTISVVDISNPAAPAQIVTAAVGDTPYAIAVSGRYAYVANFVGDTISVVDISNPAAPAQVATTSVGDGPAAIAVSGRYAYVVNSNGNTVSVVDISNPAAPAQTTTVAVGSYPYAIAVSGRYAYVVNYAGDTISVVDISNPAAPAQVATTSVSDAPYAIAVSGRYAYVANSASSTISVVDITGAEVSSLIAHSAEVGNLQSRNDILAQGNIMAGTSLLVGAGGIMSQGALSVFASSTGSTSSIFSVSSAQRSNILNVLPNGNVGINSSTPFARLAVQGSADNNPVFDVASSTGASILRVNANENVGINSSTPFAKLAVQGSADNNPVFDVASSTGASMFRVLANGYVGVNSSTPNTLFTIQGQADNNNIFNVASSTGVSVLSIAANGDLISGGTTIKTPKIQDTTYSSSYVDFGDTTDIKANSNVRLFGGSDTNWDFIVASAGNVGVGLNVTPGNLFDVNNKFTVDSSGNISASGTLSILGASDNSVTSVIKTSLNLGNDAFIYDASSTVVSINNLETGPQSFADNAGIINWINLPITTTTASIVNSFSASIADTDVLTVYGLTDGAGGANTFRLGVNTSSPVALLDIWATNSSSSIPFQITSSTGSNMLKLDTNGNLGINSSTPFAKLAVQGSADNNPVFDVASSTGASMLRVNANGSVGVGTTTLTSYSAAISGGGKAFIGLNANATDSRMTLMGQNSTGLGLIYELDTNNSAFLWSYENGSFYFGTNNLERIEISAGGNVGIGDINPGALFDVKNKFTVNSSGNISASGTAYIAGNTGLNTTTPNALLTLFTTNITTDTNAFTIYNASSTQLLKVKNSGDISFGASDGLYYEASTSITYVNSLESVGGLNFDDDAGMVSWIDMQITTTTAGISNSYTASIDDNPMIMIYADSDASGNATNMTVSIGTSTTSSYKMYIDAGASTTAGLAVNGYVKATGFVTPSTTLDLAETYPLDPGCSAAGNCPVANDVVCAVDKNVNIQIPDPDNPSTTIDVVNTLFVIEKCAATSTDNAIGVVSEAPGFVLGGYELNQTLKSKDAGLYPSTYQPVALAGRVPVKVSLANGPVKVGDLLTASAEPGVAVKMIEPGRAIGVALESYGFPPVIPTTKEESLAVGVIKVFVNPHWSPGSLTEENISDTLPDFSVKTILDKFTLAVKNSLRKLGLVIKDGVAKVKELVAGRVRTDELCVGATCVNENQLIQLLQTAGASNPAPYIVESPVTPPPVIPNPPAGGEESLAQPTTTPVTPVIASEPPASEAIPTTTEPTPLSVIPTEPPPTVIPNPPAGGEESLAQPVTPAEPAPVVVETPASEPAPVVVETPPAP